MVTQTVTVGVPGGVHARVAADLVRVAAGFGSSVFLLAGSTMSVREVSDLLALGIAQGQQVTVLADGRDEQEALAAVVDVLVA